MTLKDIRDGLSRMFAKDRALEFTDVNHVLIEDVNGVHHFDYLLKDDSETEEDEEDDDYEYEEDDDDDSELEDWEDGSELEPDGDCY